MIIGLIGNQNSGKTTLFNQLTGKNQHVGNFPGVTVEKKEGYVKKQKALTIVDLPGIYSLSPYTAEEIVTRDFLLNDEVDVILNIVDATNIERNLYLTLQLLELGKPTVLALNMMDEMRANGNTVDISALGSALGIECVPISASKNEGVGELLSVVVKNGTDKKLPEKTDFCSGEVHKAVHSIAHIIEQKSRARNIPVKFAASKLIEGDRIMAESLKLTSNEFDILNHIVKEMEQELDLDREAALADERYNFITALCKKAVKKSGETREHKRSVKLDRVLTHKYLGLPIFFIIMFLVFWLTFDIIGGTLSGLLEDGISRFSIAVNGMLESADVNSTVRSFIIDGVFTGVGSVLSFLPIIITLFMLLSLLEDSGYMARVAFVMDKLLRKIGLSGRSFVPMLIGFGCSVPAIMATRTLPSERDRKMTIMLIPFMSCSAKLPIYSVITAAFFKENAAFVMIGLYILGIIIGIISALFLKSTILKGNPVPFIMELPSYRFPSPKSVLLHMWEKTKDFLVKAFTIIFMASIIIWLLQSFNYKFDYVEDSSQSLLASIGKAVAVIFAPLGFGDWRAATALVTGLTAKEAVVSTLAVLLKVSQEGLSDKMGLIFTNNAAALSFLVFTLMYMPCFAAMAAVRRELGSTIKALGVMLYQTLIAYICAFAVYRIALLFI